jgi:hypothetical protein
MSAVVYGGAHFFIGMFLVSKLSWLENDKVSTMKSVTTQDSEISSHPVAYRGGGGGLGELNPPEISKLGQIPRSVGNKSITT